LATASLPDDLETLDKPTMVAETFGESTTAKINSNSSQSDTEDIDVCETVSLGQQRREDIAQPSQGAGHPGPLNDQFLDIQPSVTSSSHPEDLPPSSDWGTSAEVYAYTMALERQVEQLQRKAKLLERQQRTPRSASNFSHTLSQENAKLTAENKRLVALVNEMRSLRERNGALEREVEQLSKSKD
jgi:hypothetical protein